jgi:hypothetical protein
LIRKLLPILALLLFALPAGATITFNLTSSPASQAASSPNSFTITSSTGNILVAIIHVDSGVTITGCSDTTNGAYLLNSTNSTDATTGKVYACYKFSAATGITTFKTTSSGSGGIDVSVYDLSSTTGGALDTQGALNTQTSSSPAQSLTAAGAGVVLAGISCNVDPGSISAPFTFVHEGTTGAMVYYGASAYDVNASGGSLTATWGASTAAHWSGLMVSLKESGAAVVRHQAQVINQ